MTHRLYDLSQMSREQLEEIASGLKIKSIKKLDDENLAYAILDAEASLAASQPDADKPAPKKRGRKPKAEKAQPVQRDTTSATSSSPTSSSIMALSPCTLTSSFCFLLA